MRGGVRTRELLSRAEQAPLAYANYDDYGRADGRARVCACVRAQVGKVTPQVIGRGPGTHSLTSQAHSESLVQSLSVVTSEQYSAHSSADKWSHSGA